MTRYVVEIEALRVPEALKGAPLAIEIFSEEGKARREVLPLSGEPLKYDVAKGGSYLVRTTLPSGRVISNVAETPDVANSNGEAIGKAVLNLEESDAFTDFLHDARSFAEIVSQVQDNVRAGAPVPAWFSAWARSFFKRAKESIGEVAASALMHVVGLFKTADTEIATAQVALPSEAEKLPPDTKTELPAFGVECGSFREWHSDRAEANPVIRLKSLTAGICDQNGVVHAPKTETVGPLYLKLTDPTKSFSTLMIWKPGPNLKPAHLSFSSGTIGHRSGSVLAATPELEDAVTAMLFQYVRNGALEEARLSLDELVKQLEKSDDWSDPNRGILAGYVLYKLRHSYADILIPRLCENLAEFSDSHLLKCAQLIAAGESERALQPLTAALTCGVPVYTEGVRLLRESANYFRDVEPDNEKIGEFVRMARAVAAAANLDSTLTCLRLGSDIAAEFLE